MKLVRAVLLVVLVPLIFSFLGMKGGTWPIWAALAGTAYYAWSWNREAPAFGAPDRFKKGALVVAFLFAIPMAWMGSIAFGVLEEQEAELQALRESDPQAYLAELKKAHRYEERREALKEIDPEAHEKEKAKLAEERERNRLQAAERRRREEICDENQRIPAFVQAQSYMKKRLKAPSTADFAGIWSSRVASPECGRWLVHSYVDAQNSFGAMLRTEFIAEVQYLGDGDWKLLSISER